MKGRVNRVLMVASVMMASACWPSAALARELASETDRAIARVIEEEAVATGAPAAPATAATAAAAQPAPAPDKEKPSEPFAFADFSWLNGSPRQHKPAFDSEVFTLEMRVDVNGVYSFNHPSDHTLSGSAELGRHGEIQLQQLGVGGDFHYNNVRARLMTQFGVYSQITPRNDPSPSRGQFNLGDAYRYLSEAYAGYHFDKMHGINLDAGIFMSYVGLFSYYNYDNWAYQPSYVSANTPWFFQGVRLQIYPTDKLKIEPWFINGWQSYGMFNHQPGVGGQIAWRPNGNLSLVANHYYGADAAGNPDRKRFHSDDSVSWKYYDQKDNVLDKLALSFTADFGCEFGGGVKCLGGNADTPSQYFAGWMLYNRAWFAHDQYGLTVGGGMMNNPGRYLAIFPPINGATAATGSPYFTENPGDTLKGWDWGVTFDWMPKDEITFRVETGYRHMNVPYFTGPNGVTPPNGNTGTPAVAVPNWSPDLSNHEARVLFAIMVKL